MDHPVCPDLINARLYYMFDTTEWTHNFENASQKTLNGTVKNVNAQDACALAAGMMAAKPTGPNSFKTPALAFFSGDRILGRPPVQSVRPWGPGCKIGADGGVAKGWGRASHPGAVQTFHRWPHLRLHQWCTRSSGVGRAPMQV